MESIIYEFTPTASENSKGPKLHYDTPVGLVEMDLEGPYKPARRVTESSRAKFITDLVTTGQSTEIIERAAQNLEFYRQYFDEHGYVHYQGLTPIAPDTGAFLPSSNEEYAKLEEMLKDPIENLLLAVNLEQNRALELSFQMDLEDHILTSHGVTAYDQKRGVWREVDGRVKYVTEPGERTVFPIKLRLTFGEAYGDGSPLIVESKGTLHEYEDPEEDPEMLKPFISYSIFSIDGVGGGSLYLPARMEHFRKLKVEIVKSDNIDEFLGVNGQSYDFEEK
jgi:hypothetical protein